jgi:pimeloyl-ACP methyl ester carboxylesterase
MGEAVARIGGHVHAPEGDSEPVLVVAFEETAEGPQIVNYEVLLDAGPYNLFLTPGKFRVVAFEDLNQDFVRQPGEPVGELPGTLEILETDNKLGLDIQLAGLEIEHPPIDLSASGDNPKLGSFRSTIGTVVSIDDERFSRKSGVYGMWRPLSALNRDRMGVFFLEAFDPCKTPVLFIHGMQGSVQDFRPMIEGLDRTRFQAWFFAYPSGLRLSFLSRYLAEAIREIGVRHRPPRLFVVAHSMGGLIARSFINQNVAEKKKELIETFVAISTPWNGHRGARVGVRFSPVVAPAWIDMVPNSQFIQAMYADPLPPYVEFHLLFGYGAQDSSDGVVTIRSMLDPKAQNAALSVHGFDESHASILEAGPVIETVEAILVRAADRPIPGCAVTAAPPGRDPATILAPPPP